MTLKSTKCESFSKFANPEDPEAHTQSIESFLSIFKKKIKISIF